MNAEHQALAEYLEDVFEKKLDHKLEPINDQLVSINNKFKPVGKQFGHTHRELGDIKRSLTSLIDQVDGKNDKQDDVIEDHELRISTLERDYQTLISTSWDA